MGFDDSHGRDCDAFVHLGARSRRRVCVFSSCSVLLLRDMLFAYRSRLKLSYLVLASQKLLPATLLLST